MNVLITGGSGFIGRYFVEAFAAAGDTVTILDLVDPEWLDRQATGSRVRYVRGDVRDAALVGRTVRGHDAVLHLAAAHHDFGIERETFFAVNEGASRILCDACDAAGVSSICFYSTVAVYGDTPEPHFEDSPRQPTSPYGQSKLAGEKIFHEWTARGGGRRCLVIRPTVTFGPRNFANMYTLIRQIHSGRFLQVGPGTNLKSLSYVENIVDATLFLWRRPPAAPFDVYNYIDKPDLQSRQIAAHIYESLGKRPPRLTLPLGLAVAAALPFDLVIRLTGRNLPISSARVRKLASAQTRFESDKVFRAGFAPRVSLREGIDRMVKWYLAEGRRIRPVWHLPPPQPVIAAA